MPVELPNLHDAILRRIEIDWEGGCARCVLDVWFGCPMADTAAEMRPLVVTLTGLKAVTLPVGKAVAADGEA
jgi:hypothetical protein